MREEISLKKNIITSHISSSKHKTTKEKLALKEAKVRDIATSLKAYDETAHPIGETLPMEQRIYRLKVVETFLKAAVPLSKLGMFRDILEQGGVRLTDRSHMSGLIPFVRMQEEKDIKQEISEKPISVIFDGTTRLGEALAIVIRFVDNTFTIQQRLIRLQLLAKSMTGEEIARELCNVISAQYGVCSNSLLAAMHDRAACNGVALRTLKVVYPLLVDVGCFSHTLDLVGSKFDTPTLSTFMVWWISLFSHSPKAMLLWKERTGTAYKGYSVTRWWSKFEVMKQVMELFADVQPFLEQTNVSPATVEKLLTLLSDPQQKAHLMVELAVTIDAGMPFVLATYNLEGDGPLTLSCYEAISALNVAARQAYYPNLNAKASEIACGDAQLERDLLDHAKSCVQRGISYYFAQVLTSMKQPLEAFKAARFFSPFKITEMNPNPGSLSVFPFLSSKIPSLKEELPTYLAAAESVTCEADPLLFWRRHASQLPNWAEAAKMVLLVQPSSAASERVFSLLRNSFGERQNTSLQDYVEASLMLQYNNRK